MIRKEILQLRKELHKHPELSNFEYETAKMIRDFIALHHPTEIIEQIGGAGLAAVYKFSQKGISVTIRCELDALPIQENNTIEHQSLTKGASHKCGHDGHMAIVAGLIFWIKEQSFNAGEIILLFQPAEETGKGAFKVMNDIKFKQLKTDYLFALHNIPKETLHSIIIMKSGFSAEVQSFVLKVTGKESHASEPENGINPALAVSELINALSKLNIPDSKEENFTILTPVCITMGQISYGISPAHGELHYTVRTWTSDRMINLKSELETIFGQICASHKLAYDVEWLEYFPASSNDSDCNYYIYAAAQANNFSIIERPYPFKFGEDFGWFSKEYKTAMFGLGAGLNTPGLHDSDYDFPDELIESGITMFKSILENIFMEEG